MKQKNLPDDIKSKSLDELNEILNNLVEKIEKNKTLNQSEEDYLEIFRLNKFIEKKFQKSSKEISEKNKLRIKQILKKNEKKTK